MTLLRYCIKRIFSLIPITFGVLFLSFILTRQLPGNPYMYSTDIEALRVTPEVLAIYEEKVSELGLDKNPIEQFLIYLRKLFTGDWGISLSTNMGFPVWDVIYPAFTRTIELTIMAMSISIFVGLKLGITSAINRNSPKDNSIRIFTICTSAFPSFFIALILQIVASNINFLPSTGFRSNDAPDPNWITGFRLLDAILTGEFYIFIDTLLHYLLPVLTLSLGLIASFSRYTRGSMLEILEENYLRTARAKGCSKKKITYKHAFKNALIPISTVVSLSIAGLLTGALLVEYSFNIPGIGHISAIAIQTRDYFVINAAVFVFTMIYLIMSLISDIVYAFIDPRIRYQK